MTDVADLEVAFRPLEPGTYRVDLRSAPAGSQADERVSARATINAAQLTAPGVNYGKALGEMLFADDGLRDCVTRARSYAQAAGADLRVRLLIDEDLPELHNLRWELLRDPSGEELCLGQTWFSRYLSSRNWRMVKTEPARTLSALVVVASPSELATNPDGMEPIPYEAEAARAREFLKGIAPNPTVLAAPGAATPEALVAALKSRCDIVYLVCHGVLMKGEPKLWLENAKGEAEVVSAADLARLFPSLEHLPRLVVLASCQSAGNGKSEDALMAFGPRLAAAGVPAVVAMQGKVGMETVADFMPEFFRELRKDGMIDRAMAAARAVVARAHRDYWMPVLFMRLRSGSLWYAPGFGGGRSALDTWPSIIAAVETRKCTPILGPGIVSELVGSHQSLATALAEQFKFPLSRAQMRDLPTIAQYLMVNQSVSEKSPQTLRLQIERQLSRAIRKAYPDLEAGDLNGLVTAAGQARLAANAREPHRILADAPFPIYVTANPDNMMEDALRLAGKDPQSDFVRWNKAVADTKRFPTLADRMPSGYRPTAKQPLVFHMFGQFSAPESLVFAEDDYLDYLLCIGSKADGKDLIPGPVGTALTMNSLLFLGFRMDEWSFRVLLRSIVTKEGSEARSVGGPLPCIGAQITPEEDTIADLQRSRNYFEKYLRFANTDVYWGNIQDFVEEFDTQRKAQA